MPQNEEKDIQDLEDEDLPLAWSMPKGDKKVAIMIPVRGEETEDGDKDQKETL